MVHRISNLVRQAAYRRTGKLNWLRPLSALGTSSSWLPIGLIRPCGILLHGVPWAGFHCVCRQWIAASIALEIDIWKHCGLSTFPTIFGFERTSPDVGIAKVIGAVIAMRIASSEPVPVNAMPCR